MKKLADKVARARARGRLGRRAGLAADRRRLGDGYEGEGRKNFLEQVRKGCRIAKSFASWASARTASSGSTRPAASADWAKDPEATRRRSPRLSSRPPTIAKDHGERLAAEGEICWGGMHSWRTMVDLLERVGEPEDLGFQADMAHTLLYTLGENAPEDRILPEGLRLERQADPRRSPENADRTRCAPGRSTSTSPRTTPPSSARARTTTPAAIAWPTDPNGKLDIPHHAGFWLRDDAGKPDQDIPAHLLGRLHVPQRRDGVGFRQSPARDQVWSITSMRPDRFNGFGPQHTIGHARQPLIQTLSLYLVFHEHLFHFTGAIRLQ